MANEKRLDGYSNRAMVKKVRDCEFLISYWTVVGWKDKEGDFHRTWDGYSNTTVHNHVEKFGFHFSKKEWESLPLESLPYGFTEKDIMSPSEEERDIPGYCDAWRGPARQNGWSYGF